MSQQTWDRFALASVNRAFDTFLSLALCEYDVAIDARFDELVPATTPGSLPELHRLVHAALAAGPLQHHHIDAARGLCTWPRQASPPPIDIETYLFDHVWRVWYEVDQLRRAESLGAVSAPFAEYSERHAHGGPVYTYRERERIHKYLGAIVPDYLSLTRTGDSLRDQLHREFLGHSLFPDLTETECLERETRLMLDMEREMKHNI